MRKIISALIMTILSGITLASSIAVLQLKRDVHRRQYYWNIELGTIQTLEIIFDIIETIRIIIFERLFVFMLKRLLRWQNYKYCKNLEDDFVRIVSLF